MERNILARAAEFLKKSTRHKRWRRALTGMAAVVVFITSYMMILPAITMSVNQGALPPGVDLNADPDYTAELTLADGSVVTIGVYDPDENVPEGAVLVAELFEEGGEDYLKAEETLLNSEDVEPYDGMLAMDLHFEDAEGNEVEPTGSVYVDMEADALLPVDVDPDSVAVQHHVELDADRFFGLVDGSETTVEVVADGSENTGDVVVDPTESPAPSETPAVTETPDVTETPETTEIPEVTKPVPTETPAEGGEVDLPEETIPTTDAPVTDSPEASTLPELPESPEPPVATEEPVVSTLPELPSEPVAPVEPETPVEPEPPAEPETPAESTTEPVESVGDGTAVEATFAVDSFSTFTITWNVLEEVPEEPELVCGLEEHSHFEDCYDADGNLICTLEEHTHSEDCYAVELPEEEIPMGAFPEELPEGYVPYEFTNEDGLSVLAYAPEDAFGGQEVTLFAEVLAEDSDEYAQAQANLDASDAVGDYDGMVAMDIRFQDADGKEVEPNAEAGPVYVDIRAEALIPEDVDTSTLAVQHHAETTDGGLFGTGIFAGTEVTVETVADANTETGTITAVPAEASIPETLPALADEPATEEIATLEEPAEEETEEPAAVPMNVEASFGVESFSTFTITWTSGSNTTKLTVYCYDTDGNPLPDGVAPSDISLSAEDRLEFTAENSKLAISGYTFSYAKVSNRTITYIEADRKRSGGIFGSYKWYYYYDTNPYGTTTKPTINLYYEKAEGIEITDTIMTDGSLTAVLDGTIAAQVASYQWYKGGSPESNSDFTLVEGGTENALFVAADGARYYYYVEALGANGEVVATSAPFQVSYYDALQNGSFENPDRNDSSVYDYICQHSNSQFMQIPNGTEDLIWQTTTKSKHFYSKNPFDYYIEIVKSTNGDSRYAYGMDHAADGDQFAELNCEAPGALYQDVLTVPGSTLYWGLEHANRGTVGESRLLVLISDTESLPDGFNPSDVDSIAELGLTDDIQLDYTSNVVKWEYHGGAYTVPEGQYVTRFYFVAGNGNKEGNLLDNISFSSELPEPPAEQGNLIITKNVEGVSSADLSDVTFTFTVTGGEGYNETVTLSQTNSWNVILTLDAGEYTVSETTPPNIPGYSYTDTSVQVTGGSSQNGTSTSATVTNATNTQVIFTNRYNSAAGQLVIEKKFYNENSDVVAAPAGVAKIDLEIEQYYWVTQSGDKVKQSLGKQTVTLMKDDNGKFVGTMGAQYYTEFDILSETLYDSEGNVLTGVVGDLADETFEIDRNYADAEVTVDNQTATGGNQFTLANNNFIFAKATGGNTWFMCMQFLPDESIRESIYQNIRRACEQGATPPATASDVTWTTPEGLREAGLEADVIYQQGGTTQVTFDASSKWAQFYFGTFDVLDQNLTGTLTNTVQVGNVSISKVVARNDSQKATGTGFSFTIDLKDATFDKTVTATVKTMVLDASTGAPVLDADGNYTYEEETKTASVEFTKGVATITLDHGQTIVIPDLPASDQATITETEASRAGYAVAWTGTQGSIDGNGVNTSVTTTEISNDPAVTCTNTTGAVLPSTGGMGVAPYLTFGSLLTLGAGLLLLQRRRKEGSDAV